MLVSYLLLSFPFVFFPCFFPEVWPCFTISPFCCLMFLIKFFPFWTPGFSCINCSPMNFYISSQIHSTERLPCELIKSIYTIIPFHDPESFICCLMFLILPLLNSRHQLHQLTSNDVLFQLSNSVDRVASMSADKVHLYNYTVTWSRMRKLMEWWHYKTNIIGLQLDLKF